MRIGSATNERTAIASVVCGLPTGDTAATFYLPDSDRCTVLAALINSVVFDFVTRSRVTGLHLDYHVWAQNPLPKLEPDHPVVSGIIDVARRLSCGGVWSPSQSVEPIPPPSSEPDWRALTLAERIRLTAVLDALVAVWVGLGQDDLRRILQNCDRDAPSPRSGLDPKGFWRTDKQLDPELRRTVLALVAFRDLDTVIRFANDDPKDAVRTFSAQHNGMGWMLPEIVHLAEHGLGNGDRAKQARAVASLLGPRFYDWQLAQRPQNAWLAEHLQARNVLGGDGSASRMVEWLLRHAPDPTAMVSILELASRGLLPPDSIARALTASRAQRAHDDPVLWLAVQELADGELITRKAYETLLNRRHHATFAPQADGPKRRLEQSPVSSQRLAPSAEPVTVGRVRKKRRQSRLLE